MQGDRPISTDSTDRPSPPTQEPRRPEQRPISLRLQSWQRLQEVLPSLGWSEASGQCLRGRCFRVRGAEPVNYQFVFPALSATEIAALARACPWLTLNERGLVQSYTASELLAWLAQWPDQWQEPLQASSLTDEQCWRWQYTHARCRQWSVGAQQMDQSRTAPWPTTWSQAETNLLLCLVDGVDGLYFKLAALPYLGDRLCQAVDQLQRQTLFPPEQRRWRLDLLSAAAGWLQAVLSSWHQVAPLTL